MEKVDKKKKDAFFYKDLILLTVIAAVCILLILTNILFLNSRVTDGKQFLPLYEKTIDLIYDKNSDMNENAEYMAINMNSLTVSSETEKVDLINYEKKNNENVLSATLTMLGNSYFSNDDGSLKGVYIYIDNLVRNGNNVKYTIYKYKNNDNLVSMDIDASYINGNWVIKDTTK